MTTALTLLLLACGEAPTEPAKTEAPAAAEQKAAPAEAAAKKPAPASTSGGWAVPGDGVPDIDESNTQTLESGLTIVTTEVGTGPKPVKGQTVKVHYHGWLADGGTLFGLGGESRRMRTWCSTCGWSGWGTDWVSASPPVAATGGLEHTQ